jgi:hypothetical protein
MIGMMVLNHETFSYVELTMYNTLLQADGNYGVRNRFLNHVRFSIVKNSGSKVSKVFMFY